MYVLVALSSIASEQTKGTERTLEKSISSPRLLGITPRLSGKISSIRYGVEHPFGHIIFE
jgi:hypothetical protein